MLFIYLFKRLRGRFLCMERICCFKGCRVEPIGCVKKPNNKSLVSNLKGAALRFLKRKLRSVLYSGRGPAQWSQESLLCSSFFAFSDVSCYIIFKTVQGRSITTSLSNCTHVCMYVCKYACMCDIFKPRNWHIITSCKATPMFPEQVTNYSLST